jgi:hypothetical protein
MIPVYVYHFFSCINFILVIHRIYSLYNCYVPNLLVRLHAVSCKDETDTDSAILEKGLKMVTIGNRLVTE